uniref:Uncharacterized protein n=1 Tax=Panagrolaimus sp. ES5 TaxID=591445 RepID=A0AC34GMT5_9BILA
MANMEDEWFLGNKYKNVTFVLADDSQDRLTQLNRAGINPRESNVIVEKKKEDEVVLANVNRTSMSADDTKRNNDIIAEDVSATIA